MSTAHGVHASVARSIKTDTFTTLGVWCVHNNSIFATIFIQSFTSHYIPLLVERNTIRENAQNAMMRWPNG